MATLVQFLAAGVAGARNGTATFVLRGTASSAAGVMWNEFEELTQPATNIVTLDTNGGAEIYCDAYVDVTIRDFSGTILRTVTLGNSDGLTEVQSTSFTGTDYDGNPASTAGEPITLAAVLDKWITSAGATDWKVLFNGSPTTLQVALAGALGFFTNVKDPTYGAVGDGVTDDTTAILAATTAAAGGIVFFPKGTYKVTTLALGGANINWLGCGAGASIISGTTSTNMIGLQDNTNTAWKNFSGLSFTSSGSYTRLFLLEETQNVSFSNCAFDCSNCAADAIEFGSTAGLSKLIVTDCDFVLGATVVSAIRNQAATSARSISVKGCTFSVSSGFTGRILRGADFNVANCRFDASAVTSGSYWHIDSEDATVSGKYVGNFVDNKFLDGAGSGAFVFRLSSVLSASNFVENGNSFIGFVDPALTTDVGHIYDYSNNASFDITNKISLGSRRGKQLSFLNNALSAFTVNCQLVAETIYINHTNASALIVTDPSTGLPHGLNWNLVVENRSAGTRTIELLLLGVSTTSSASVTNTGRIESSRYSFFDSTASAVKTGGNGVAV